MKGCNVVCVRARMRVLLATQLTVSHSHRDAENIVLTWRNSEVSFTVRIATDNRPCAPGFGHVTQFLPHLVNLLKRFPRSRTSPALHFSLLGHTLLFKSVQDTAW